MGKPWIRINGEHSLFCRTKCGHCDEVKAPRELFLIVDPDKPGKLGRQVGKLQIYCETCMEKLEKNFVWIKRCDEISYPDIKEIMETHRLVLMSHGKDLFIDFCIIVCDYRSDVRFQSY